MNVRSSLAPDGSPVDMPLAMARRYWSMLGPAEAVLDVGCGAGALARTKPATVQHMAGIDRDEQSVRAAAAVCDARMMDLDRECLPFRDGSFDAVVIKDILEHVSDPVGLVRDCARVLRPRGRLVASMVTENPRWVWADVTHRRGFTRAAAVSVVQQGGFHVDSIGLMGPLPGSIRLGYLPVVPWLLRLPGIYSRYAASHELVARRNS